MWLKKIKRVFEFIPVIWNSFDFDYSYADRLYIYQLKRLYKTLLTSPYHDKLYDCSKLNTYISLYEKVLNEDYLTEYFDIITKKYGDDIFKMNFEKNSDNTYYMTFEYEKIPNNENIKKDIETYKQIGKNKHEKAKRLLKLYENKYKERWWC